MLSRTILLTGVLVAVTAPSALAQDVPSRVESRPSLVKVAVPPGILDVDDGDTVTLRWTGGEIETVRILGIDCPETRHPEHDIPYDQPFGPEAQAFAAGVFATAQRVEILRAATPDPYGRTLAYLFVDGRNYSTLAIAARLAVESVTAFGDNGLPAEAAAVMAAARAAGPVAFEAPHLYRARMRAVSAWLKSKGLYPP